MANRVPPYDENAENSVIGAMLLSLDAIERVQRIVKPTDFYRPANGAIYAAILRLWGEGKKVDPITVADALKSDGNLERCGGSAELLSRVAGVPTTTSAPRYAEIIVNKSMYRSALGIANEITEAAYSQSMEPQRIIEEAIRALGAANINLGDVPDAVWTLDDYLNQPPEDSPEWIVEDIIRQGWRIMVVAAEGAGKTTLFRQVAICAAQGIHPFLHSPIPPKRTLIVDCENPQDSIVDVCTPIRDQALRTAGQDYDSGRAWLWWKPQGIDLRSRSDRIRLESVIQHVKPDLVAIGPVYKIYQVNAHENDELAAREVMATLDDLRTRYSFGLMMEHHAPKGTGNKREMMPFGTSLWLRWPELGISMEPLDPSREDASHLKIGRWRGDRLKNEWPKEIRWSTIWPWEGIYETGTYPIRPNLPTTHSVYETEDRDPDEEQSSPPDTQNQLELLTDIVEGGIVQGYGPQDSPF